MPRPRRSLLLAALAALAVAGCGEEDVTDQVRSTVEGFGDATKDKDYQRICDELLAKELVENVEQVGLPCEQAWRRSLADVREPSLAIRSVVVAEQRALVEVTSAAKGQKPSLDTIELRRESGRWRISSLTTTR